MATSVDEVFPHTNNRLLISLGPSTDASEESEHLSRGYEEVRGTEKMSKCQSASAFRRSRKELERTFLSQRIVKRQNTLRDMKCLMQLSDRSLTS